ALGRRLDQDLRPRPLPQHRRKPLSLRPDPPLDHLTALRQDADLAFHFVHVDANMLHGWPPPLRHTTACTIVGLRPPRAVAASRFIPSIAPTWEYSVGGNCNNWPTQSGMEYFYGFFGCEADQWQPTNLYQGQAKIPTPETPGYHFLTDMTDHAIG